MKKIFVVVPMTMLAIVPTVAQNFEFKLSKLDTSTKILEALDLIFESNKVTVSSTIHMVTASYSSTKVLTTGIVDKVSVTSTGEIVFYDKDGKVICAIISKNNGSLNTIAYKKDGQLRGTEIDKKNEKFLSTFNSLKQWIKDNNGRPSSNNHVAKQTTSVPKITTTAKRDPNLLKLIERPIDIDITGGKATVNDILKQCKTLSLPDPEVDEYESALIWENIKGVKILNFDVPAVFICLSNDEVSWEYWIESQNQEKATYALEQIREAIEACGINVQQNPPYSKNIFRMYSGLYTG